MHFSQIDYSALQWAAVESITNIDHSQGRGCGGPGETIPLLALTSVIRLDGDDDDGDDGDGGHDDTADGDGGDDDADDNEKEIEVVHSSTAADTCDTSYVFSSHILVSLGSIHVFPSRISKAQERLWHTWPGPRIRRGAWQQEICAARSLGKRVFRDKIKIATKTRKLHYFGKFMEFMMLLHSLVLKLPICGHSVIFTKV